MTFCFRDDGPMPRQIDVASPASGHGRRRSVELSARSGIRRNQGYAANEHLRDKDLLSSSRCSTEFRSTGRAGGKVDAVLDRTSRGMRAQLCEAGRAHARATSGKSNFEIKLDPAASPISITAPSST